MSRHHMERVCCPKCKKEDEFVLWDSINTKIDPELKEKVRTGELFKWTCPQCGNTVNVNYTTLYHQMEDHVMIYLVFGEKESAVKMMQGFLQDTNGKLVEIDKKLTEDYRNRVVGSMNEFQEKLMILDAGLDDRVIEVMKLILLSELEKNDNSPKIQEFLFCNNSDGTKHFAVNTDDNQWGMVEFHNDLYDHIENMLREVMEADRSVVIDQKWAMDILSDDE